MRENTDSIRVWWATGNEMLIAVDIVIDTMIDATIKASLFLVDN